VVRALPLAKNLTVVPSTVMAMECHLFKAQPGIALEVAVPVGETREMAEPDPTTMEKDLEPVVAVKKTPLALGYTSNSIVLAPERIAPGTTTAPP